MAFSETKTFVALYKSIGSNREYAEIPWAPRLLDRDQIAGLDLLADMARTVGRRAISQGVFQVLVNLHDRSLIPTSITVIRR